MQLIEFIVLISDDPKRICNAISIYMLLKIYLRTCETLSSAREIASVALTAERKRRTENVFHIVEFF